MAITFALAIASLVVAWWLDRRRRLTLDLATVPAAAVYAGRNEVRGRAWHPSPTLAHYSETPCIYWVYAFQERRRRKDTWYWHTLEQHRGGHAELDVVDASGSVRVHLDGALLEERPIFLAHVEADGTPLKTPGSHAQHRHIERGLAVGDPVFVSGDGHLDPDTLEPDIRGGTPLIVTLKDETDLRVAEGWFTVAAAGSALFWAWATGAQAGVLAGVLTLVAAAAMLWVGILVTIRNRIQALVQAADRAWNLIDVQLARRHDLVPKLVAVARAAGEQERVLQESAASADWSASADSDAPHTVGAADDEARTQTGHIRHLLRAIERHPELESEPTMIELRQQLSDAESRIDGARTVYNDTIEGLRVRRTTMPAPLVVRWTDQREFEYFSASGFERTVPPVTVDFDSFSG